MTAAQVVVTQLAGLGVTVLPPEDIAVPSAGRLPGQSGGIGAYLTGHPDGYVQVEQAQSLGADDYLGTYWVPVSTVAITLTACAALSELVRRALCGVPIEPGPLRRALPDQPRLVSGGFYLCRQTYEIVEIDGAFAV